MKTISAFLGAARKMKLKIFNGNNELSKMVLFLISGVLFAYIYGIFIAAFFGIRLQLIENSGEKYEK